MATQIEVFHVPNIFVPACWIVAIIFKIALLRCQKKIANIIDWYSVNVFKQNVERPPSKITKLKPLGCRAKFKISIPGTNVFPITISDIDTFSIFTDIYRVIVFVSLLQ